MPPKKKGKKGKKCKKKTEDISDKDLTYILKTEKTALETKYGSIFLY